MTRRWALGGMGGLFLLGASHSARGDRAPRRPPLGELREQMEAVARDFHGVLGYSLHLRGKHAERLSYRGDERFPTASTIKTVIMCEALHQVELGKLRIGETIAVAHLEPKADGERVLIRLEAHADTVADPFKPTRIMGIVSAELERLSTPVSATVLANMVPSHKPKLVRQAIARLIVEGYVAEIRQGRTTLLRLVRPYGEGPPPAPVPPPELPLEDVEHVPDLELVPDHDPDDPYGDGIPEHY